jgi:hypothetical protein
MIMKNSLIYLLVCLLLISCGGGKKNGSVPVGAALGMCPKASTHYTDAGFNSSSEVDTYLTNHRVTKVKSPNFENQVQFIIELKKFPSALLEYMANTNTPIRIIYGRGMTDDPTFNVSSTYTKDGRSWSDIVGTGGGTTRIVVNSLYENHGSFNLVLHEHGHTLDYGKYPGGRTLHLQAEWKYVMENDKVFMAALQKYCGNYCTTQPEEAFAEAVAMYYSCDKSKSILNDASILRDYFQKLEAFRL